MGRLIDVDALMKTLGITDMNCEKCAWVDKEWSRCKRGGDFEDACCAIENAPTIEERKNGKWIDKYHAYFDEEKAIEEWQSCKCSVCGRYDTRPYMYYFKEPHFCSWCGADMRERREE